MFIEIALILLSSVGATSDPDVPLLRSLDLFGGGFYKHVAPTALGWVSAGGMEVQPSLRDLNCAAPNPALKRRAIVICHFRTGRGFMSRREIAKSSQLAPDAC